MIRIKLDDGDTVETYLHTLDQALAAKAAGADLIVGGDKDTWMDESDLLGGGVEVPAAGGGFDFVDDPDIRGTMPRRTIAAASIESIVEVP